MPENHKSSTGVRVGLALFATLVLYPLSVGPAAWLYGKEWLAEGARPLIFIPFGPLIEALQSAPAPIQIACNDYVGLWTDSVLIAPMTRDGSIDDHFWPERQLPVAPPNALTDPTGNDQPSRPVLASADESPADGIVQASFESKAADEVGVSSASGPADDK